MQFFSGTPMMSLYSLPKIAQHGSVIHRSFSKDEERDIVETLAC